MNKRQLQILSFLSNMTLDVPLKFISEKENISIRTLRSDIKKINSFLTKNKMGKIQVIDNKIVLDSSFNVNDIVEKLDFYEYTLNKKERIICQCLLLLYANDFVTYNDIASNLCYSRSTIIKDSNQLKKYLKRYSINLESISNNGIRLKDYDEKNIRKLFFNILENYPFVYEIFKENILFRGPSSNKEDFLNVKRIISKKENKFKYQLNKKQFNILSDYLFFIQRRNRNSDNYFTTVNFKASKFTEELIDSLGKDYKIYNPKAEIAYLSLKAKEFLQPGEKFDESIKIQVLTLDLIEKVSADLDIDLTYDYSLFKNLSEHLQRIFFEGSVRTSENIEVQLLSDTNQNLASIVEKNINELEKILKKKVISS